MIQYSLKCENDHSFDSWFASADAYDKLLTMAGILCGLRFNQGQQSNHGATRAHHQGKRGASRSNIAYRKIRSRTGHGGNAGTGGTKFRIRRDEFTRHVRCI